MGTLKHKLIGRKEKNFITHTKLKELILIKLRIITILN